MSKRALVLSGGGMFGAWQAGAWSVFSSHFQPFLIVGASVGSLNGYAIAAGCSHEEILELWRRPQAAGFRQLPATIHELVATHPLQNDFSVVLVNLLRMREEIVSGPDVTWQHLVASCAVPGLMLPKNINGGWYLDGGLINVLPLPAALKLGATDIFALNALPEFPIVSLRPFVRAFQRVARKGKGTPPGFTWQNICPRTPLGSLKDASFWNAANVERWYAQGIADAHATLKERPALLQNISMEDCLGP
ncbi:MAG: patatin-like phospholipase family protein [Bryobacteraceae bacterium]